MRTIRVRRRRTVSAVAARVRRKTRSASVTPDAGVGRYPMWQSASYPSRSDAYGVAVRRITRAARPAARDNAA
jgi:hypothetical protein